MFPIKPREILPDTDNPCVTSWKGLTVGCRNAENHHDKALDLSTDHVTGKQIASICDGYVEKISTDNLKGNFVKIQCVNDYELVYGHIMGYAQIDGVPLYEGQPVSKGQIVGFSGGEVESFNNQMSTGPHLHMEVWKDGEMVRLRENLGQKVVVEVSAGKSIRVYMTHYHLSVRAQNDSSPCIGAAGNDLCEFVKKGNRAIALTSDQRKKLGIKFWDKVRVEGDAFDFEAYVLDEMNARFRNGCIKKQGLCIKADHAQFPGTEPVSGPVTITKI